jgi:hypothetical protein
MKVPQALRKTRRSQTQNYQMERNNTNGNKKINKLEVKKLCKTIN